MTKKAQSAIQVACRQQAVRLARGQSAIESPSATARQLHGQSAMEFLMTYGWAILIMLVVISILFYLGVFSPETVSPKSCVLPAGFSCYGYKIATGGVLTLQLTQSTGHTVTIEDVRCSDADNPSHSNTNNMPTIYSGEKATLPAITCYKSDDTSTPAVGEYYRGTLVLKYMDLDTNIEHRITGDIGYRVET